jgi:hypothetical protein
MNNTGVKYGGRTKGVQNKQTKEAKELLSEFLKNNHSNFLERFNSLNDKDYCSNYISLLKYIIPTLKATEITEPKKEFPFDSVQIEIITNKNK